MNIPAVLRIAAQPVPKAREVTRAETSSRSDGTRGRADHSGQIFTPPAAAPTGKQQQAAVVQFGGQAVSLARESEDADVSIADSEIEESGPLSEAPEFEAIEPREDSEDATGSQEDSRNTGSGNEGNEAFGTDELSAEEQQQISQMRSRDREVRTHEQAHKAAGAGHTGSIHLDYDVGPDGKRYAVAGSVSIDASGVANDAEATLRKMELVQRAALAPATPSGADRQVASAASRQAQQARAQIAAERYAETQDNLTEQLPSRPGNEQSKLSASDTESAKTTESARQTGAAQQADPSARGNTPFSMVA